LTNQNLFSAYTSGRTIIPVGPVMFANIGPCAPSANAAVTLTSPTVGTGDYVAYDIYAQAIEGNLYILLAVVHGTNESGRTDLVLVGTAMDFPTDGVIAQWYPQPPGAHYWEDRTDGLHARPTSSGIGGIRPSAAIVVIDAATPSGPALLIEGAGFTQAGPSLASSGTIAVSPSSDLNLSSGSGRLGINTFAGGSISTPATNAQTLLWDFAARLRMTQGTPPAAAAGAGAGTGPTITVVGTDQWGRITVLTGTAPTGANASIVALTYRNAFANAPYGVRVLPANAAALNLARNQDVAALNSNNLTTGWTLSGGSVALAASTSYAWTYDVLSA